MIMMSRRNGNSKNFQSRRNGSRRNGTNHRRNGSRQNGSRRNWSDSNKVQFKKKKGEFYIKQETQLEEDIKKIEHDTSENLENTNSEKLISLNEKKKNQLYEIRKHKLEGVMLRSRCRYEDLGEKPTSYFLNLEKQNFTKLLPK